MTEQTNTLTEQHDLNTSSLWDDTEAYGGELLASLSGIKNDKLMAIRPLDDALIEKALKEGIYIIIPRTHKQAYKTFDFVPSNGLSNISTNFKNFVPMTIGKPSKRVLLNAMNRLRSKHLPERIAVGFIPPSKLTREFLETIRIRDLDMLAFTLEPVVATKIVRLRTRFLKEDNMMPVRFGSIVLRVFLKRLLKVTVTSIFLFYLSGWLTEHVLPVVLANL